MTMGLFTPKNPPDTISDKEWRRIQRGASKTEAREGGMFSKKAVERRKTFSKNLAKKGQN
jgi:hypothetical protein